MHALIVGMDLSPQVPRSVLEMRARSESLHHLLGRHRAPEVRCVRTLRPCLWTLRIVPVPRARIEITQRFVLHLIEFGEQLCNEAIRAAVIGEEIVPDAVPSRSPQDPIAVVAQEITRGLHMRPIAQLERRVEMLVRAGLDEIDRMMIDAASQER